MRNEEPTRTDPPPGFTGDLAADLGASLSRESELAEGFADARFALLVDLAAATEVELTTAARALSSQAAHGHVELRRLYGRQAQALVATLPLGVVRLQGGWR